MQVDKETVAQQLRDQGDHDRADQAESALPRHVDTDRDASLLHQLDVDVSELPSEAPPDE